MIQQPIYQDLSETPEFQQQMMLCPVRVVYDTQMFLQPGEQVQQNPYIINPQNPPPWIQNQVQNQVIYVQNVPNNYMPAYQQHVDQNQFQNYGYNLPQMLVQAPQDTRHLQNVISANLVPNINVNQRAVAQNIGAIVNPVMVTEVQNPNVQTEIPIQTNQITNTEINKPHDIPNQAINHQVPLFHTEQRLPLQPQIPVISNLQPRLPQFDQNNIQIRQIHPQVVAPNVQQNIQTLVPQKVPANVHQNYQSMVTQRVPPINKTNYQVVTGNGQPIYRAIQPRPSQFYNQPPRQNIVYMNSIRRNNPNTQHNTISTQNIIPNFVKLDSSRKRKSESPDEVHNKVVISNQNNVIKPVAESLKPVVEIISNPTPVSKSENKIIVNSLQITPIDTQNAKIKEELAKPIRNISLMEPKQMIRKKMINNVEAIQNLSNTNVQDKLVRNTVYMQARGRLITEQQEPVKNILQSVLTQSEDVDSKLNEHKTEVVDKNSEKKKDTKDSKEIKTDSMESSRTKDEKSFLLTHVLDGYVIQESNTAFPIRKPLKEKTLRVTTEAIEPKRGLKEETEIEQKTEGESERLLDIAQLHLKEDGNKEVESKEQDNPFAHISPKSVRSWTVDQLSEHLKKFKWEETISLLQDHEIDGESLFLVSKAQLMNIGISEDHASIICDFIKIL